jgi:phage-related baseplate assembly protein
LILRFRNDMLSGVACHCFTMSHRRRSHQVSVSCADVISYRICRWPQAASGAPGDKLSNSPARQRIRRHCSQQTAVASCRLGTRRRFRAEVQRCSAPYA